MAGLQTKVRLSPLAGRRAYEAHVGSNHAAVPWERLRPATREHWDMVAKAVLNEVRGDAE